MKNQRLFTYGTLKRGQYFYPKYLENQSEFIGKATTSPDFTLYIDALPHMVRENSNLPVKGELFMIDEVVLGAIDRLEGHPLFYTREIIDVYDETGSRVLAWAYLRNMSFKGRGIDKEEEFL